MLINFDHLLIFLSPAIFFIRLLFCLKARRQSCSPLHSFLLTSHQTQDSNKKLPNLLFHHYLLIFFFSVVLSFPAGGPPSAGWLV